MAQEIKEGDLVKLKSGGPTMTVDVISNHTGLITCKFFVGDEARQMQCQSHSLNKVD